VPDKAADIGPSIGPILQMIDPSPDLGRIRDGGPASAPFKFSLAQVSLTLEDSFL
jgi:hypothetical protein